MQQVASPRPRTDGWRTSVDAGSVDYAKKKAVEGGMADRRVSAFESTF